MINEIIFLKLKYSTIEKIKKFNDTLKNNIIELK